MLDAKRSTEDRRLAECRCREDTVRETNKMIATVIALLFLVPGTALAVTIPPSVVAHLAQDKFSMGLTTGVLLFCMLLLRDN